jgi:hypothetical protein
VVSIRFDMLPGVTTESDADLMARFPQEAWSQPLPVTNLKTREVRYDCRLCIGLQPRYEWGNLPTDETLMLAHIKEQHGLEPIPSGITTFEQAAAKIREAEKSCHATATPSLTMRAVFWVLRHLLPSQRVTDR